MKHFKKNLFFLLTFMSMNVYSQDNINVQVKCWILNQFVNVDNRINDSIYTKLLENFESDWVKKDITPEKLKSKSNQSLFIYSYKIKNVNDFYILATEIEFIVCEVSNKSFYRLKNFEVIDFSKFKNECIRLTNDKKIISKLTINNLDFKNLNKSLKSKFSNSEMELKMTIIKDYTENYYSIVI